MIYFAILGIILIIIALIIEVETNKSNPELIKTEKLDNYTTKKYIMTETELNFYRELKKGFEEQNIEYNIFPEINLERIIQVKNYNNIDRNKIKSRSIDFTIVNNKNCKIVCCIELDDYTHNRKDRIKRDNFINNLFESVNIKLFRVSLNNYNINNVIDNIKEVV